MEGNVNIEEGLGRRDENVDQRNSFHFSNTTNPLHGYNNTREDCSTNEPPSEARENTMTPSFNITTTGLNTTTSITSSTTLTTTTSTECISSVKLYESNLGQLSVVGVRGMLSRNEDLVSNLNKYWMMVDCWRLQLAKIRKEQIQLDKQEDMADFELVKGDFKLEQSLRRLSGVIADLTETDYQIQKLSQGSDFPGSVWDLKPPLTVSTSATTTTTTVVSSSPSISASTAVISNVPLSSHFGQEEQWRFFEVEGKGKGILEGGSLTGSHTDLSPREDGEWNDKDLSLPVDVNLFCQEEVSFVFTTHPPPNQKQPPNLKYS
eukprot:TRINITY_DN10723_c0_g1_i2.p1 TRINITY_DN10723_c0_g1~~TRINITY_DN10723_c0_g1_i2.p1  ORF type:complete len:335 (+),score=107.24 TRINITY_DN10723_c0_g1_i2:48-1007(+)